MGQAPRGLESAGSACLGGGAQASVPRKTWGALSLSFPMKESGCAYVRRRPAGLGAEAAAWWEDFC